MSFKKVQMMMSKKQGISMDRAGAMLAAGTRRTMRKRGISNARGIPKGVFKNKKFKIYKAEPHRSKWF